MAQEFLNGPDQILPATHLTITKANEPVRLRIPETGTPLETRPPISVPSFLKKTAEAYPDHPALAYKENGTWSTLTYSEYLDQVTTCAKAFLKLGLQRYHSVCILGSNSPEWLIADLGAIFAGGIAVGIYLTNSSEACFYCADFSKANVIVVQDQKQLEKILAVKNRLPHLKAIVQYEGKPSHLGVISWSELMAIGRQQPDKPFRQVLKKIGVNECCTMIFTSGTTGNPKAVLLSHDNLTSDTLSFIRCMKATQGEEVLVSFLPLSHIAAQMMDIYIPMTSAGCVYFADANALKGTLINTIREARPTIFFGVPRIWEKFFERLIQAESGGLYKTLLAWAKNQALRHHLDRINGIDHNSWSYQLANYLVFSKIKEDLGLHRTHSFISGGAPISVEIKKYFLSLDMELREVYGLSESTGPHACCVADYRNLETVGPALSGFQTSISNPENGEGEICMYGRHIYMGYLGDQIAGHNNVDVDGWFHTGDVGRIDDRGLLYVTGRIKELLITAGGENIPPVPIEQLVKKELPHVSNAFLVGDKKKFLIILLTLKTEVDPSTGKPLDALLPSVKEWLTSLGCPASTVTEVLQAGPDSKLLYALNEGIDSVNHRAVSNAQKVQKLAILPADFSVATGELGPTMKVKRNVVIAKYADIIDKMYT